MTADRKGLGFLGLVFAGVTVAVMLMAGMVVMGHIDGSLALEGPKALALTH